VNRHFTGDESFLDYEYTGTESAKEGRARWRMYVGEALSVAGVQDGSIHEHGWQSPRHENVVKEIGDAQNMIPNANKMKARI
jgi:hypothetical protein